MTLQRRTANGWKSVIQDSTSRRGRIRVSTEAPAAAGRYVFRAKAGRTVTGSGRRLPAVVTPKAVLQVFNPPGSRENPLPAGSTFEREGWRLTVGATDFDTYPETVAASPSAEPPAPGWSFVGVAITYTNTGTDVSAPWIDTSVDYFGGNGIAYDRFSSEPSCTSIPNDALDIGDMFPGATATGNECADVPMAVVAGGLWRIRIGSALDSVFVRAN